MSIAFPAVCPTRRRYTPGRYPTRRYNALNGASFTRLFGSRAFDAELDMEFILDDTKAAAVLRSWHDSKGGTTDLSLPSLVFTGVSDQLSSNIPTYLNWRWAEVPSVESLFPGKSRVQVRLIATLDA